MSELRLSYPACMLVEKSKITPEDVRLLETRIFAQGLNRRDDVPTLLAIEHSRSHKCADWDRFFVKVLVNHVLNGMTPAGVVSAANADWLRRTLSRGGVIGSRNEFEVLVRVLELSQRPIPLLCAFALDQVRIAVVEGEGPLATRRKGLWASLGLEHLAVMNRILQAIGSREPFSIADAEVLFDPAQNLVPDRESSAWGQFVATLSRTEAMVA